MKNFSLYRLAVNPINHKPILLTENSNYDEIQKFAIEYIANSACELCPIEQRITEIMQENSNHNPQIVFEEGYENLPRNSVVICRFRDKYTKQIEILYIVDNSIIFFN